MTAAGEGCATVCEMDVGAIWTSGPGTAIGEVVAGSVGSFGCGNSVAAMLMFARLAAWVGGAGDGRIFAEVGFAGGGATIVLTVALLGDQTINVGTCT